LIDELRSTVGKLVVESFTMEKNAACAAGDKGGDSEVRKMIRFMRIYSSV
jgi:hypothetical protein